jgi:hypothetical protein
LQKGTSEAHLLFANVGQVVSRAFKSNQGTIAQSLDLLLVGLMTDFRRGWLAWLALLVLAVDSADEMVKSERC